MTVLTHFPNGIGVIESIERHDKEIHFTVSQFKGQPMQCIYKPTVSTSTLDTIVSLFPIRSNIQFHAMLDVANMDKPQIVKHIAKF